MVCSVNLSVLNILDHPVSEFVDMTRSLEHIREGNNGSVELQHVFLNDIVLSPLINNVGQEGGTGWSIVVESGNTFYQPCTIKSSSPP
jgi:hypothetical protein